MAWLLGGFVAVSRTVLVSQFEIVGAVFAGGSLVEEEIEVTRELVAEFVTTWRGKM